jgi:hypothetical protein
LLAVPAASHLDFLNNLLFCLFQRPSARHDSQIAWRPIARIARRPEMRKAP